MNNWWWSKDVELDLRMMFRRVVDRTTHDQLDHELMDKRVNEMSNTEFLDTLASALEGLKNAL